MKERSFMLEAGAWDCHQRNPHHVYSVGEHTEKVVEYCDRHGGSDALIKAAWLHDAGKMEAKTFDGKFDHFEGHAEVSARIAQELGESEYVIRLVKYHGASERKQPDELYEKLAGFGKSFCEDLALLMEADLAAQHPTHMMDRKKIQRDEFLKKLFVVLNNKLLDQREGGVING